MDKKLETLRLERNSLVDTWKDYSGDEKVKILVQIMDLEDDINALLAKQNRSQKSKVS